jgi:MYXO-CTERM domain-containing protein
MLKLLGAGSVKARALQLGAAMTLALTWGLAAVGCSQRASAPDAEALGKSSQAFTLQKTFTAPGAAFARQFGARVDFQADTAVITAPAVNSVYVFERTAGVWQAPQKLDVSNMGSQDVVLDGDTIAVTAMGGAAVYVRSAGTWTFQQQVQVVSPIGSPWSLALRGNTLVVGTFGVPTKDSGAAYVFTRSASTWTHQQTLTGTGLAAGAYFGQSVALGNDLILVGAPQVLGAPDFIQGAAFVFTRAGSTWSQVQRFDPPAPAQNGYFGDQVVIDRAGTRAVIVQFKPGTIYGFQIAAGQLTAEASGTVGGANAKWTAIENDRVINNELVLRRAAGSYSIVNNLPKGTESALFGGVALVGGSEQASLYCVANCGNGSDCVADFDCASAVCQQIPTGNVCCDKPCPGSNESCLEELTGVPTGTCAPVQDGEACTSATECGSGHCTQGVCCSAACSAANDSCLAAETGLAQGICGPIVKVVSCTVAATCGSGSCVDGYCCDKPCTEDSNGCENGTTGLANGTCGPIKNGIYCDAASQCGSGFCSEHVCCDSSCGGVSQSCRSADTGLPDGTCGPAPSGVQCYAGCDSGFCADNICCNEACDDANEACVYAQTGLPNGTCGPVVLGVACGSDATCASGHCADSVCCDAACTKTNDSCLKAKNGIADGVCGDVQNGSVCANDGQCGSGFCREGVCCEGPCGGTCESCRANLTGASDGMCAPIPEGQDPQNECDPAGSGVCRLPGTCSGARACKTNQDVACGTSSCASDSVQVNAATCDGEGACQTAGTSNCAPYRCLQGACASSCTLDGECLAPAVCLGSKCLNPVAEGETCDLDEECGSGHCAEGVCCDLACAGACESCLGNQTGKTDGQCAPITTGGSPRSASGCKPSGGVCGADGKCDGAGSCRVAAPEGTSCGSACEDGSQQLRECDGFGTCATQSVMSCLPYGCVPGGNTCASKCSSNDDCAAGAVCNRDTGECAVSDATCKGPTTVLSPDGSETDCKPYRCAAGVCRDTCSTSNDCAAGYTCQVNVCRAETAEEPSGTPASSANVDKGCGCKAAGAPSHGTAGLAFMLGIALLARRRRAAPLALAAALALVVSCKKHVGVTVNKAPTGNDDGVLVDCSDAVEPETHGGPTMVPVGREDDSCVWVDTTEVTAAQVVALAGLDLSEYESLWPEGCEPNALDASAFTAGELPAVGVDWCAAATFCAWAGKRLCGQGEAGKSEWESTCNDGDHADFRFRDLADPSVCQLDASEPSPVGSHQACVTPTAVFDLVGNVREWTADCSGAAPGGTCQVLGGSFLDGPGSAGCDVAKSVARATQANDLGFRCCADVPP